MSRIVSRRAIVARAKADGVSDLAALDVFVQQGQPFDKIPIHVEVSCGRPRLQIESTILTLAVWQVLVRIYYDENCQFLINSAICDKIQHGTYESETKIGTQLKTIRQHASNMKLDLKINAHPFSFLSDIRAGFSRSNSTHQEMTKDEKTASKLDITLTARAGNAIAIGDNLYGDPTKDHGLLANTYPRQNSEETVPLFKINVLDPAKPTQITLATVVPFDKLCLLPGKETEIVRKAFEDRISDSSSRAIEECEELRMQFLRDTFQARVSANQKKVNLKIEEGEFAVMIETFRIEPQ